jgi:hypothetical protein
MVQHRIIFNPNYGGKPCEVPGSCLVPMPKNRIKPLTRAAIKDSIAATGVRNPILVYRVQEHGLVLSFGGGRLYACQELDEPCPAIVVDYVGDYSHYPEVTPSNYGEFFTDIPAIFEFFDDGISTHYGLERGRDEWFDPAGVEWTKELDDDSFLVEESPWLE